MEADANALNDPAAALQVTNHARRGDGGEPPGAGLGLSWSHVPRTRLLLERSEGPGPLLGGTRTATLVKSSRQVRSSPPHATTKLPAAAAAASHVA